MEAPLPSPTSRHRTARETMPTSARRSRTPHARKGTCRPASPWTSGSRWGQQRVQPRPRGPTWTPFPEFPEAGEASLPRERALLGSGFVPAPSGHSPGDGGLTSHCPRRRRRRRLRSGTPAGCGGSCGCGPAWAGSWCA